MGGIDSSMFADDCEDKNPIEPLPSLIELDRQVRESGRLKKPLTGDYAGRPAVSDIEVIEKTSHAETDFFGQQKPYAP